ncbi:MAG: 2-C-methyl-D-erythritol 2,4-cyclodiphosphate synthase [Pseudomonadota bacterium]
MRVGIGYDIHRFGSDKELILGDVKIEHDEGLLAHSDGDVLLHSIMDALLGAAGLGDIGTLFPPTDAKYKDAKSTKLLSQVLERLTAEKWEIENIDCNIIAQKPKLSTYQQAISKNVADLLNIDKNRVNIKIRSNENLDAVGEGKAIAVQAVALIKRIQ